MLSLQPTDFISIADYLHSELSRDIRHEYVDGQIYAMAGASKNHQRIISNLVAAFSQHLKNVIIQSPPQPSPCQGRETESSSP